MNNKILTGCVDTDKHIMKYLGVNELINYALVSN
jgi:hypothetical protein